MYNASVRAWVWDWTTITSWDRNWKGKKSSFIGRKPFFFAMNIGEETACGDSDSKRDFNGEFGRL